MFLWEFVLWKAGHYDIGRVGIEELGEVRQVERKKINSCEAKDEEQWLCDSFMFESPSVHTFMPKKPPAVFSPDALTPFFLFSAEKQNKMSLQFVITCVGR